MPILLDYTFHGVNHPDSWWVLTCLNINRRNKTANVLMFGYHDKAAHDANPDDTIDIQNFTCTDSEIYDFYFGAIDYTNDSAYVSIIEVYLIIGSPSLPEITGNFFNGGIAYSAIDYVSAEIGDVSGLVVAVTFNDNLQISVSSGATINVNGSPATISSYTQPVNTKIIYFTLSAAVNIADEITFEYDGFAGGIADDSGFPLQSIAERSVTNQVGEYWRFSDKNNSAHIALTF